MNNKISRNARALLAAGILLLAARGASAMDVKEGEQYTLLRPAQPTDVAPGKVQVVEVFWYACGHCYAIEPKVEAWLKKGKPAYVEFVRMPATWNELLKTHARVFYTAGQVPAHSVRRLHTREEAIRYPRGDLELASCPACGFIFNVAFDPALDIRLTSFLIDSMVREK